MSLEGEKIFVDCHLHSEYSFDGSDEILDICKVAYQNGLKSIAITDHCDINKNSTKSIKEPIKKSYDDILKAQAEFSGKMKIYAGIELGQPLENISLANEILNDFDFDFTLLSLHNLPGKLDFYFMEDFSQQAVYNLLNEYFDQLLHTFEEFDSFDSLAHLTYPLRYVYFKSKLKLDLNLFADKVDEILKFLVKKKKALEVNVSGFSKGINCTLPGAEVISRYKSLGGEYVTLGSDAHKKDFVGRDIDKGIDIIKASGFEYVTVFEKHIPRVINI